MAGRGWRAELGGGGRKTIQWGGEEEASWRAPPMIVHLSPPYAYVLSLSMGICAEVALIRPNLARMVATVDLPVTWSDRVVK